MTPETPEALQPAHWSLVQHTRGASGELALGVLDHDGVHALPPPLGEVRTLLAVLEDWARWRPLLQDLDPRGLPLVDGAVLAAPVTYPRKILCAGANYYSHAQEMGTARPDPAADPFFFLKPATTVVGDGAVVRLPADHGSTIDWEAELAVVIADTCSDVPVDEARAHIAGYLLADDLSDRGHAQRPDAVFPAFTWDWLAHKGRDGFCPVGPGMVPVWAVPDPQQLRIRLWVNDDLKQDASLSDMVVGVDALVAAASRLVTLEPGDLVLTGTPAGVGMPRGEFLSPGDVVTVEMDLLGRLTTTMAAGSGAAPLGRTQPAPASTDDEGERR